MNVFIDANILYNDPFMKSSINQALLNKVNRIGGMIFLSDIVYKEVENNFIKQLDEVNDKIDAIKKKLKIPVNISKIDTRKEVIKLQDCYKEYQMQEKITILKTDNNLLPEVIDRAIKRKKPFSENKEEFRDCLIWLTYVKEVEESALRNPFFITRNISDFYDKKGNLHKDLKEDTTKIKLHKDVYQFLETEAELFIELEERKIVEDIRNISINDLENEDYVIGDIEDKIRIYLENISSSQISKMYTYIVDFIDLNFINIENVNYSSSELDIENNKIYYFGKVTVIANIDLKQDLIEDDYSIGNSDIKLKMNFSMDKRVLKNKDYKSHSISNRYIMEKNFENISVEDIQIIEYDKYALYDKIVQDREMAKADMMDTLEEYYNH